MSTSIYAWVTVMPPRVLASGQNPAGATNRSRSLINNIAMATSNVKETTTICLPMIGHLFDTITVAAATVMAL